MTRQSPQAGEKSPGKPAAQRCIAPGCGASFGLGERIYVCSRCGGPLEIDCRLENIPAAKSLPEVWRDRGASPHPRDRSGVWRYRELLPFDDSAPIVTLFEGNTPVYDAPRCAAYCALAELRLKHLGMNPTASFKDTGMTVAVTQAVRVGAQTAMCASTGNTAASLAAYSARANLQCAILLPRGQISSAKLAQSLDYGAIVLELEGNFDDCMRLIRELGDDPSIYVANSINPYRIEGQKTVAFELMEQCGWQVPDHVVVPGGNMGNSSALGKGFSELLRLGLIERQPQISVIQAEGAAPLAHLFAKLDPAQIAEGKELPETLEPVAAPQTLATAIKIGSPVSWKKALRAVLESRGQIISVSEQQIADAKAMVGRDGVGCEPASATTIAGIRKLAATGHIRRTDSVVAFLTGHLLKDADYVSHYHRGTLSLAAETESEPAQELTGAFRNASERVAATKVAILDALQRRK